MAKEYAKKFYKSKAWQQCRKAFIADRITIDGGMCQACKEKLGYICDHIEEINPNNINDIDITLNHKNLQYLCLECHNKKTFGVNNGVIRDGLKFDENGDIVYSPH